MNSTQVKEKSNQVLPSTDTIQTYLKEIGKIPLLEQSEEIILGKQVQKMMSLVAEKEKIEQKRGEVVNHKQWANAVDLTEKQLKQVLHQGAFAKNKMVQSNLRLVVSVAKKYQKRNVEFLDLIQEGSLGLQRGVEKFDPGKGYRFSTYAYWWIRQAITRAIAQQSKTIRIPVHITEKLNKIRKAQRELAQKFNRSATTQEVAQEIGIEPEQVLEYLKLTKDPISLDLRVGKEEDTELSQLIEDYSDSPEDEITQRLMKRDVEKMLKLLKPREREVLSLRFGFEDGEAWSLSAIGKRLNLSRERVRQVESRAIANLKHKNPLAPALRDYLVS
ncbi:MAG: RNA polymerase sigma factor, RpoD/SigA family [Xenococcaceae cyanobacterium MO_234.B1]|nr:RNA polymerase sigma factor, RpoD/SigA family [Xenococcaceae cyanobacterium MO_234.B1]